MAFCFEVLGDFARESLGGAGLRGVEYGNFERRRPVRNRASGSGGVEASEKPLSQPRCSVVKGALSGIKGVPAWLGVLLRVAERLEFGDRMAACEDKEGLFGLAMLGIGGEEPVHCGCVGRRNG